MQINITWKFLDDYSEAMDIELTTEMATVFEKYGFVVKAGTEIHEDNGSGCTFEGKNPFNRTGKQ